MKPFFHDEPQPEFFDYKHVGGRFLGLVGMAAVAFAVLLAGAFLNTKQFAFSYLFAYTFFFTICMGGLFWTLVHHAVDAEWSVVVRRQLENIASLFVVMAVLFIPLLAVGPLLWKWMEPANAHDPLLLEKAAYLNKPFFYARAIIYFAFFVLSSSFLRAFSIAQDNDGAAVYTVFNRRVAFSSAIPFAICLTFAAVDWLMGLDYHWYSTMWGVYIFAGAALGGGWGVLFFFAPPPPGDVLLPAVAPPHPRDVDTGGTTGVSIADALAFTQRRLYYPNSWLRRAVY